MRRVAVFAGRSEIDTPRAFAIAHEAGRVLGENHLSVVALPPFVGALATTIDATLAAGGRAIAVVQEGEAVPETITERRTVDSMDAAQAAVGELADAFLGLPGGLPSFDTAFAMWEWSIAPGREQPLGLLDIDDYYSDLLRRASDASLDRFVLESQRGRLVVAKHVGDLLRRLADYRSPETRREAQ